MAHRLHELDPVNLLQLQVEVPVVRFNSGPTVVNFGLLDTVGVVFANHRTTAPRPTSSWDPWPIPATNPACFSIRKHPPDRRPSPTALAPLSWRASMSVSSSRYISRSFSSISGGGFFPHAALDGFQQPFDDPPQRPRIALPEEFLHLRIQDVFFGNVLIHPILDDLRRCVVAEHIVNGLPPIQTRLCIRDAASTASTWD